MMFFEVENSKIITCLNSQGHLSFYGNCKQQLNPITIGDTGSLEMISSINDAECSFHIGRNEDANFLVAYGDTGRKYIELLKTNENPTNSFVTYNKNQKSLSAWFFLSDDLFKHTFQIIEKMLINQNLMLLISVGNFIGFRSNISDAELPTLNEFYEDNLPLYLGEISFILKNSSNKFHIPYE